VLACEQTPVNPIDPCLGRLDEIRDRDYDVFDRSVDVHISALRKKLGDDPKTPRFIRTVRSAGYMCIEPDNA